LKGVNEMRLLSKSFTVSREGYVKNEDELENFREDVERIVQHYHQMMEEELDQAGYIIEWKK